MVLPTYKMYLPYFFNQCNPKQTYHFFYLISLAAL